MLRQRDLWPSHPWTCETPHCCPAPTLSMETLKSKPRARETQSCLSRPLCSLLQAGRVPGQGCAILPRASVVLISFTATPDAHV